MERPQTFAKDYTLKFGGAEVRLYSFGRGHSGGDTMAYFPDAKVVMVSDQMTDNAPIVDFANGGSAVGWAPILDGVLNTVRGEGYMFSPGGRHAR